MTERFGEISQSSQREPENKSWDEKERDSHKYWRSIQNPQKEDQAYD